MGCIQCPNIHVGTTCVAIILLISCAKQDMSRIVDTTFPKLKVKCACTCRIINLEHASVNLWRKLCVSAWMIGALSFRPELDQPRIFMNVNLKVVHTNSCRVRDALLNVRRSHSEVAANVFGTSLIPSTFPNAHDHIVYIADVT